jgi:nucleoside-diphosphate-sugar epimerase
MTPIRRVLLTGAAGFTGRYLAKALNDAGYEVHGLVHRRPSLPIAALAAVHELDLLDFDRLQAVVQQVKPNKVAHLAAIAFVPHSDVDAMYRTNVVGTRHLLEALACAKDKYSPTLDAVLLASSANVYGELAGGLLTETTPAAPSNDYAVSKLAMEHVAQLYSRRLPLVLARPFNYTGVGQTESFLIPKIVNHIRRRAAYIELGNLHVARDFSDVRMVVQYYQRLLEMPAAVGQTLNVCSGSAYTLNEVLTMAQEIAGHALEVRVNPAFVRANEVKQLMGSRARLDAVVGHVPQIALADTLAWMLSEPL